MICQIRGTSGSGKTTVMREVLKRFEWEKEYRLGRKKPLLYRNADVVVLGHYEESACGGCDTIGSAPQVFKLIQETDARVILCEGLLLSEDIKWALRMDEEDDEGLRVLFLTTSLEECLARIAKRRAKVGNDKPLNPGNTSRRVAVIERARVKLTEAGVWCRRCSQAQALNLILELLRLHA